jgi:hypothetical protein
MGILVPSYTKLSSPIGGGLITPTELKNVYLSLRFENPVLQHNPDGVSYTVNGRAKVYQNPADIYVQDIINYNFTVTKDKLTTPLHDLIYSYLKTQYPGASDAN